MTNLLNDQPDYDPCANCGDEWSQTVAWSGKPLCEECYNAWKCGCESCVRPGMPDVKATMREVQQ